jgi:voltage-gated potassium channel
VLVALYYLLPLDDLTGASAVGGLIVGIALFLALVAWEVWRILRSVHPETRALEALFVVLPLFLLMFATAYFLMGRNDPADFTEPLTRSDALYFTVTVFATVGFGDVSPQRETTRLVVTGQMILDLIFLGVGIRTILGAVQRSKERSTNGAP